MVRLPCIATVLVSVVILGAGCEVTRMKWTSDCTFDVDREAVKVGEPVEVTFSVLKREGGRRYYVVVVAEDTPLEDAKGGVEVPVDGRRVTVRPRVAGLNAVRVYVSPPEPPRYIAGRKVTVTR